MAVYVVVCFAAGLAVAFSEAALAPEAHANAGPSDPASHIEPAVVESPKDGRANYNYSVIPGGARNPQELAHAMQTDSVVADHYRDVDPASMRPERMPADRLAYVSYRKNDQVFWTKNKVRIYEGETILTNGDAQIRGRCGNAISMAPMLPTADDEPDTAVFDALTDVGPKLVAFDLTPWGVPFMGGVPAGEVIVPPVSPGFAGPMGFGGAGGGVGGGSGEGTPEVVAETPGISSACAASMARIQRVSSEAFPAEAITLADACGPESGDDPTGDPPGFAA
ncbi:MAG TPA: hypothetical protein VF491_14610, partial [Vicinamibacterales bacterium]